MGIYLTIQDFRILQPSFPPLEARNDRNQKKRYRYRIVLVDHVDAQIIMHEGYFYSLLSKVTHPVLYYREQR